MRIVLKGDAARAYFDLLRQDEQIQKLADAMKSTDRKVDMLAELVTDSFQRQEQLMGTIFDKMTQDLNDLEQQISDATTKIVNTVQGETEEDREQNTRLAGVQQELAAAQAEIQRLRDQIAAGMGADEAAVASARIATLTQKVIDLAAQVRVTDPNAPA